MSLLCLYPQLTEYFLVIQHGVMQLKQKKTELLYLVLFSEQLPEIMNNEFVIFWHKLRQKVFKYSDQDAEFTNKYLGFTYLKIIKHKFEQNQAKNEFNPLLLN